MLEDNGEEQEMLEAAVEVVAEMQLTAEELKVRSVSLDELQSIVPPLLCGQIASSLLCGHSDSSLVLSLVPPLNMYILSCCSLHLLSGAVAVLIVFSLQLGLRRLVTGEKDFSRVFQSDDQPNVQEQIVARANKYSKRLVERAEKELDLLPFSS